jgi:hypothetical protein
MKMEKINTQYIVRNTLRTFKHLACFVVLLVLLLNQNTLVAQSQTPANREDQTKRPRLGNHKFVISPLVRDPFIKTHIRNTLGIGNAYDLEIPVLEIGGETVYGLRGDLLFALLDFEYQNAVKDWLAVWGKFGVVGRLGTGVQTLLAQGITAGIEFELGWMFKFLRTERTMLSGTLNLSNSNGTVINLAEFINDIIEKGELAPENELVRKRSYLRGGGGLRFAWAASDLFGVNLIGEGAYGESIDRRDKNKLFVKFGGSVDFDLKSRTSVPLGFALGFVFDSFPSGGDNTIDDNLKTTFLRIAYTGREDFLVSLDATWLRLPLRQLNQTLNGGITSINMRYYF